MLYAAVAIGVAGCATGTGSRVGGTAPRGTTAPTVPACLPSNLRAVASWEGAGAVLLGGVLYTNRSARPCLLVGHPHVSLLGTDGNRLAVVTVDRPPAFTFDHGRNGGPVVVRDGRRALSSLVWANWCHGKLKGPLLLDVELPGRTGRLVVPVNDGFSSASPARTAPCGHVPARPSQLAVGNFVAVPESSRVPWIVGARR